MPFTTQVALWNQRMGSCKDTVIIWDYHGTSRAPAAWCMTNCQRGAWIHYDLDTCLAVREKTYESLFLISDLGMLIRPSRESHWRLTHHLQQYRRCGEFSFFYHLISAANQHLISVFRVVPGKVYLASDRSYMVSRFKVPPIPWVYR